MEETRGHRELVAWQKAMDLVEMVYVVTADFPKEEVYGLTSQMRRSAVSVPSNIAEGHGAGGGNYLRHLDIAYGSLMELQTQAELCLRVELVGKERSELMIEAIGHVIRPLSGLRKSIRSRES